MIDLSSPGRDMPLRHLTIVLACVGVAGAASLDLAAWGLQGHRLVALVAAARLTPAARANVEWLLPDTTLAEVASWADEHRTDHTATGPWHYVNVPSGATRYDRDRDCPRQPGVAAGSRGDRWRDCVVDRILYNQQVLADERRDRVDRAIALKFLVHFVAISTSRSMPLRRRVAAMTFRSSRSGRLSAAVRRERRTRASCTVCGTQACWRIGA